MPVLPAAGRPSAALLPVPLVDDAGQHLVHRADQLGSDDAPRPGSGAVVQDLPVAVPDIGDAVGEHAHSAIRERRISRDQLEQIDLVGAEREARVARQSRPDAEPAGGGDDMVDAGALRDLRRHRVDRLRQRRREASSRPDSGSE